MRGVEAELRDEPLHRRARPPSTGQEDGDGGVPGGALEPQEPVGHGDGLGAGACEGAGLVFGPLVVPHALIPPAEEMPPRIHADIPSETSRNPVPNRPRRA